MNKTLTAIILSCTVPLVGIASDKVSESVLKKIQDYRIEPRVVYAGLGREYFRGGVSEPGYSSLKKRRFIRIKGKDYFYGPFEDPKSDFRNSETSKTDKEAKIFIRLYR